MLKDICIIIRAYSWPASITPVIIGTAIAIKTQSFHVSIFLMTLIAALSIHSGANLANTHFDFKSGVDKPQYADDRGIVDGMIGLSAALKIAVLLMALGSVLGIYLTYKTGATLMLAFGMAGLLLAWFYTSERVAYKYKALGEIGIFTAFGPLIVTGTVLLQTGYVMPYALKASIPIGLLIVAILHANNLRDIDFDNKSGIKTLAGIMGIKKSVYFYKALIISPYILSALAFKSWPFLLPLISAPFAFKLIKTADNKDFSLLVKDTAKFVGIFGLLFTIGILI